MIMYMTNLYIQTSKKMQYYTDLYNHKTKIRRCLNYTPKQKGDQLLQWTSTYKEVGTRIISNMGMMIINLSNSDLVFLKYESRNIDARRRQDAFKSGTISKLICSPQYVNR